MVSATTIGATLVVVLWRVSKLLLNVEVRKNAAMKDLTEFKERLSKLILQEFVSGYLQGEWKQWLIEQGIPRDAAGIWSAETYQVLDEFLSRTIALINVVAIRDIERVPYEIASWAWAVKHITAFEIVEPVDYLLKMIEPYLPPEPERGDEDEDDMPDEVIQ